MNILLSTEPTEVVLGLVYWILISGAVIVLFYGGGFFKASRRAMFIVSGLEIIFLVLIWLTIYKYDYHSTLPEINSIIDKIISNLKGRGEEFKGQKYLLIVLKTSLKRITAILRA